MTCQVAQGSVHYKLPSVRVQPLRVTVPLFKSHSLAKPFISTQHFLNAARCWLLPFFKAFPLTLAPRRPAHARPHVQSQNKQLGNLSS